MFAAKSSGIQSTPDTLAGKPRIAGTRLSVAFICQRVQDGWTHNDILRAYPALSMSDIKAAIEFNAQETQSP